MKKQIYFLAIFILFSCNNSEEEVSTEQIAIDSLNTVLKVKEKHNSSPRRRYRE